MSRSASLPSGLKESLGLLIKVKLTELTFKTGNKRGYNNMIRKRVPNSKYSISKEVTISSGNNTLAPPLQGVRI